MAANPCPEVANWLIQVVNPGVVNTNRTLQIGPSDTVSFRNGCTFPINIVFSAGGFGTITLQPGQDSSALGGNNLNVTYNYWIEKGGTVTGGPYAVQFGIGPLEIVIASATGGTVAIPNGGEIQFSSDAAYNISWTFAGNGQPANVWSPQPTQIPQGQSVVMRALAGANSQILNFALDSSIGVRGGGTVKVNS
jgi:hypothetical protein